MVHARAKNLSGRRSSRLQASGLLAVHLLLAVSLSWQTRTCTRGSVGRIRSTIYEQSADTYSFRKVP
jgi:hypothetical protein